MRKKQLVWVFVLVIVAGALIAFAQAPPQVAGQAGGSTVRDPGRGTARFLGWDSTRTRGAVTGLLGWKVGVPANAFRQLSFSEAAGKIDALNVAFIEGFSAQKVSPDIPGNLDYNLSPDERTRVANLLKEFRLQMPAYHVDTIPSDESSRRRLFEFAKSLGVETIVSDSEPASLASLDQLTNEFGISVAFENQSPKSVSGTLQGLSKRIGVSVDIGKWMAEGIKPLDGLSLVNDRLIAVNLRDRSALGAKGRDVTLGNGAAGVTQFLLEMSRLQPPAAPPWPPKCGNCAGPTVDVRPLFLWIDTTGAADTFGDLSRSVDAFEKAIRPAMGYRVNELSRKTPISATDQVPPEERQKIEAGLPRQAIVKPAKPRKLLVLDICPAGAYYHATIPHANLALELMGKYTGAYEPVFSNDLDNLKYPKIRQFDAVFLNNVGGQVFVDPDVLNGLTRFVREGGGLAGLHEATYASMNLPEFGEMMGAQDGPHRVEPATMKMDDPNSPLTKAFGGKDFAFVDEFYHFLPTGPYSREKLHVLLSINTEKSDMSRWKVRPDNDYGLSWVKSYGKGRIFNCALGHTPALFATPQIAEHILAGIQFVLGDLRADTTPSAKLAGGKSK